MESLGCWKDNIPRALKDAEKTNSILDGSYPKRERAIGKCYDTAKSMGRKVFAVQDGGQCFTEPADKTESHKKYGPSDKCKNDGEGGPLANEVYKILESNYPTSKI